MLGALIRSIIGADQARLLYRLLIENAWPYRWAYAAALVMMLTVSGMFAAVALLMKDVFNEGFIAKDPEALKWLAGLILVIFMVRGLAMYGQTVILARIGNRIVAGLQARLYAHILQQGMVFHETNRSGDLAVRITQNCNAARNAVNMLATRLGVDLTTIIGMIAVMFWNDVMMSLIALIGLPVIFGGVSALVRRVKKLARDEVTLLSRILSVMNETVLGAKVVKSFNLEATMQARAGEAIEGVRNRADRMAVLQAIANPLMEVTAGIAAAAVLLYAGSRIIQQDMDPGTFISFLVALIAVGDPARRVAQITVQLRQQTAAIEFIYETLDSDKAPRQAGTAPALSVSQGEVRLEDLHFRYGDAPALNGLTLTARGGEVTALVGPSGAGKSTVLSLIERFYDPTSGTILVDGQHINAVQLASLRDRVALVTQETFLFDDTVARNIGFGRLGASHDEIKAAAKAANAHDFIRDLPDGYDSMVGEGGASLSGGQRQRVAIARAMLRDAPILLLDEATSALDAESEAHVQDALARLMQGRTTIVIAHRLATIRKAHHIAVIDKGKLVEEGTHAGLMSTDGLYARLARLQFGAEGERE